MKLITAKEAKELSQEFIENNSDELLIILNKIKEKAKIGKTRTVLKSAISDKLREDLIKLGYQLPPYGDGFTAINW